MATYASTHVIDEIGLWQLETKGRVPEQEQGGGGEGPLVASTHLSCMVVDRNKGGGRLVCIGAWGGTHPFSSDRKSP
jgi:hypothetical protein